MSSDADSDFPTDVQTWELDSIFSGGPTSEAFTVFLGELADQMERLDGRLEESEPLAVAEGPDGPVIDEWVEILEEKQRIDAKMREASGFARANAAAHTDEPEAVGLPSRVGELRAQQDALEAKIVAGFEEIDDETFGWLKRRPAFDGLNQYLREFRRDARRALPPDQEELVADLQRDGLHAWGDLYQLTSGGLNVEFEDPETGAIEHLSVGQAKNRLSDPDRPRRRAAHRALQRTWGERAPLFASILNSVVGSRSTICRHRGIREWREPVEENRVRRETIDAMFEAGTEFQPALQRYLSLKADALGVERLEWFDLQAPPTGGSDGHIDYREAQTFIVEQVGSFSEKMADFYRQAFRNRWVEAEDRPGKAQGAFCVPLPVSEQMRVFATYSGTMAGVRTLAHELGHAYHGWVMRQMRPAARKVPMTLAESASTLSEMIVEDAALEEAEGDRELELLDHRLQRAVTFLLDIPARFDLEIELYRLRTKGRLDPEQLTSLTRNAFRARFGDELGSFDDFFWASKLHYYMTRMPFYNFPYTFGYLFSQALYDVVRESGGEVTEMVDALLRDSGRLTADDLAERYLGADLTDSQFWINAASSIAEDVEKYATLVER